MSPNLHCLWRLGWHVLHCVLFGRLFFGRLVVRDHWVCPHSIKCATAFKTIPASKTWQENHFQSNRGYVPLDDLCLDRMGFFRHLGLFAVHTSSTYYRVTNTHHGAYHNCMHIIIYKIRHFQFQIAVTRCFILRDSAQGMPHPGFSGEAGLGQYTDEENPAQAKNAADSATFCKTYIQHATPKVGLTLHK